MIYLPKKPKFFGQQLRVGHWSTNGLVFYWRGIKAGNVVDESLFRNHGTLVGPPIWVGDALSFNGSSDYVTLGDIDALDGIGAETISVCVKPTGSQSILDQIIGKWSFAGSDGFTILLSNDYGTDDVLVGGWGGNTFVQTTGNILPLDEWTKIVAVFNGSLTGDTERLKIYVNGIQIVGGGLDYTGTVPTTTPDTAFDFRLGANSDDLNFFSGQISDSKVYNRALFSSEIIQLYNNPDLPIQIESPKSIFYGISGTKDYSRGDEVALPGNDDNLENAFTSQDYSDVLTDDETRISQSATGEYAIFLFKNKNDSQENITLNWNGQSDRSPSDSAVYLQIYNRNSTTWENLDSDDTTGANTDFDLTGTQSANLNNYFDDDFWISWRVYQQAI